MNINMNFTAYALAGLIVYFCIGCECEVFAQDNQSKNTGSLANINKEYMILQLALAKESELNYIAETNLKGRNGSDITAIEYVTHLNGAEYRRAELRNQNEGGRIFGPVTIANQQGIWHYTRKSVIKDCADFIAADTFYVKIYKNLNPAPGEFKVLSQSKDNNEYILIERTISNHASQKKIQELIQIQANDMLAHISGIKTHFRGVTDNYDIIPVRAVYKISKSIGIIIEDAYFNKSGDQVTSTRKFDKVSVLQNIPMSLFELPRGLTFHFPKTVGENWDVILSL